MFDDKGHPDALFFHQLLLPMCDPSQSGIRGDPRKGYYSHVTNFSNLYKFQSGIGNLYSHQIAEASMPEFVRWDGCLHRDGVRGGGEGAIYQQWKEGSSAYDSYVSECMTLHRWSQLKRIFKLCNNDAAKKPGDDLYDPAYKYDMIYNTIVHNVIAVTKNGELDITGDETTWGFQGFGEKDAKIVGRINNKPGITKGGQTVLVSASKRIRPYWYQHRHRYTKRYGKGFTCEGPSEVRTAIDALEKHVIGREAPQGQKKIFKKCPHLTFDNYFSGEAVFDYAGQKGFGLLMTTRRDRLPAGVRGEYMHKRKTEANPRSKCARYIQPVVLVKQKENYEVVLTSFQSTSSCNIMSVNSFIENMNFIEARSRGRKSNKRHYVIEQNQARLLYLKTYSRIDSLDHLIRNCKINYRTWKYWHAPVNHAKALAIVIAYDMYLKICEGQLDPRFKVDDPVDFFTFRDILSIQLCRYDPHLQEYPGDEKMRMVTQLDVARRAHKKQRKTNIPGDGSGNITFQQYNDIRKRTKRICYSLSDYEKYVKTIKPHKNAAKCAVCGEITYKRCQLCNVSLHHHDIKGPGKEKIAEFIIIWKSTWVYVMEIRILWV